MHIHTLTYRYLIMEKERERSKEERERSKEERERSKEERQRERGKERRKGERERREKENREQRTFIHKGTNITITTKIQSSLNIKTYGQKETSWWRRQWLCASRCWRHQEHTFRHRSRRTPAECWRESLTPREGI